MNSYTILKAQLGKVMHMVPRTLRTELTTLDGDPVVTLTNRFNGNVEAIIPASDYIAQMQDKDRHHNWRKGAGTEQVRTPQTRGASWR